MAVRHLVLAAYALLLVPILVFFWGWLRWYAAAAATALLVGGFAWLYRADFRLLEDRLRLPWPHVAAICALFGLWVALSGICGVGAESIDIPYRRAILADLIAYDWPVVYGSTGYALVYYYGFWMVPALVGKLAGMGAALFAVWAQECAIIILTFLILCAVLRVERPSRLWMVAIVLVGFSGLNIIGALFGAAAGTYPAGRVTFSTNLGWLDGLASPYPTQFMYRTNTDTLSEVFNQTPVWLAVALMLQDRRIHSYLFLGLLLVPYSPWALIGICPLMVCLGIMELAERRRQGTLRLPDVIRAVLSPANAGALLAVGIVYGLFYASASTMSSASAATRGVEGAIAYSTGNAGIIPLWELGPWIFACYLVFCLLTFGAFAIMLAPSHRRDPLFWTCVAWLAIIPLIWVSSPQTRDFCMNVSLAPLALLMVWVMGYLDGHLMGRPLTAARALAWAVIAVALAGGLAGIGGKAVMLARSGILYLPSAFEAPATFADGDIAADSNVANFLALDPGSSAFFTYLAR